MLFPQSVFADEEVTFADANLEQVVREYFGLTHGETLWASRIEGLDYLYGERKGISSLGGLEYATDMSYAYLEGNSITNLGPLANLPELQLLDVSYNQIANLPEFASPLLEQLFVSGNPDISLADLPGTLRYLGAGFNELTSCGFVAGLTNLENLNLVYNQISDIVPLSSNTNLTNLLLSGNQIIDISTLTGLTNLVALGLDYNQITDIKPLVDNYGIGSGDILSLTGNPLNTTSINTYIPELAARGVTVFFDPTIITGYVEDGYGHKLGGIELTLLDVASGTPAAKAITLTDAGGKYTFGIDPVILPGRYQIEIALEYNEKVEDTDTVLFSVNYDTGSAVHVTTDAFNVQTGTLEKNISFTDTSLTPSYYIPQDRLGVLALSYYHGKQVIDFENDQLAVKPDLNLPVVIHEFTNNGNEAFYVYDESSPNRGDIFIGDIAAALLSLDRPMNLEWHEMFHELMDDTINVPEPHVGDNNHKGFANHCTGDSWVEGWADAWASLLKRYVGGTDWRSPDWRVYEWEGGVINLEENIRVWESEEDAVAGLLIDLVDTVEPLDNDWITLNNNQLWQIIGNHTLQDMYDVYLALQDHGIGQIDSNDADLPLNDLDALFVAHGFFADDGDHVYELGEAVGFGGKVVGGEERTNRPTDPVASIRIRVTDDAGATKSGATLLVNVVFPGDQSIYNYSYTEKLPSGDEQLGFYVAPSGTEATINLQVRSESGILSGTFSVSNVDYWQKVSESTTGYADEYTFVIGTVEETTEGESGGMPVWVWPVIGVVMAVGLGGGYLIFRRRAKSS